MLFSPNTIFFFLTLTLGTILSISSTSWLCVWVGLELNLMSFIPLIAKNYNMYFSESALKYFLIQATASAIIIMASTIQLIMSLIPSLLLLLALIMKLGAAPFHFWLPQVMEGLSWSHIYIIMSLQKVAPLYLLSCLNFNIYLKYFIIFSAAASALLGALNGYNTSSLRKILAFSSINHMAWMLMSISMNEMLWITYFAFYVIISFSIIFLFDFFKTFYLNDMSNIKSTSFIMYMLIPICLFSLGGLPPFTGFFPKWLIIQMLISNNSYMILSLMLFSTLITLFFYIRICIFMLLMSNPIMFVNSYELIQKKHTMTPYLILLNIIMMFTPIMFIFL
uniref:NADH-ubiquinone oxidoreductase chain 2 n=1 Tax=Pyrhila pisum TaxID=1550678 RepID=A0A159ZLR0_PYRPS|nr:NADH dehydrogenase subunit 2 [Pyrhila pisum]AMY96220.1 NADH dehydrogenase subunit 2 [Pyrhila pisum]